MSYERLNQKPKRLLPRHQAGMTLAEVLVALAVAGLAVVGIVNGYLFCARSVERSALSLAAQGKALERLEQTRGAKWDTTSWPAVDQLVATNFPDQVVVLDRSGSRAGITYGTIILQISQIASNPPLKRIYAACVWRFNGSQLITNSIETCRAPD
jgi:prepilin-type N-terminal cleavage/methylation domain-containing protein